MADWFLTIEKRSLSRRVLATCLLLAAPAAGLLAQTGENGKLVLNTGKEIYQAGCAACHGPDGKGTPESTLGFTKPKTFPDFTECDQTTPELDKDWKATIRDGGHGRGYSPIMPSFLDALTSEQMDKVIRYMRAFCREKPWPRGELNLPLPLVTEKAYPEDETIVTAAVNAQGAPAVTNTIVYEKRFGVKNQIEVAVPVNFLHQALMRKDQGSWYGGVGDIGLGLKRVIFSSLRTGSILSVEGLTNFATGDKAKGLGAGTTVFEGFAAFAQILPRESFIQLQAGTDQPTHTPTHTDDTPRTVYLRTALGKTFRQERGLGRMWTPMVEWVGDRDFRSGAKNNWDVLPEMQVTLSKRQHVRVSAGVRIPVTNTADRPVQIVFYALWDFFDGSLLKGWK